MLLKKISVSFMVCALFSQHILCGTAQSVPRHENDEEKPVTRQSVNNSSDPSLSDSAIGTSAVILGAAIAGYGLYKAFQSTESQEENSLQKTNFEEYDELNHIDLSSFAELTEQSSEPLQVVAQGGGYHKVDLHDARKNFLPYLHDEIYRLQKLYHESKISSGKVLIITGTGKKRPGPNCRLKNAVIRVLKEDDFFLSRILSYEDKNPDDGFVKVFLRKYLLKN